MPRPRSPSSGPTDQQNCLPNLLQLWARRANQPPPGWREASEISFVAQLPVLSKDSQHHEISDHYEESFDDEGRNVRDALWAREAMHSGRGRGPSFSTEVHGVREEHQFGWNKKWRL